MTVGRYDTLSNGPALQRATESNGPGSYHPGMKDDEELTTGQNLIRTLLIAVVCFGLVGSCAFIGNSISCAPKRAGGYLDTYRCC